MPLSQPAAVDRPLINGLHRLHLPECPYLRNYTKVAANSQELATKALCRWCEAEVNGAGRTYFEDLDVAMRAFGTAIGTKGLVRAEVAMINHDCIWIPHSRSYIALGLDGASVAWVMKTFLEHADGRIVQFPDYAPRNRVTADSDHRHGAVCPRCYIEISLSGECDFCG